MEEDSPPDPMRLIAELEEENAYLRRIIRMARERLWDAHGRDQHTVYLVILAVGGILRRGDVREAIDATPEET
jgi:hypothetical protein